MENMNPDENRSDTQGFASFASKRIVIVVVCVVIGLWLVAKILGLFSIPSPQHVQSVSSDIKTTMSEPVKAREATTTVPNKQASVEIHAVTPTPPASHSPTAEKEIVPPSAKKPDETGNIAKSAVHGSTADHSKDTGSKKPLGVAFVEALIEPMDHELNHRWWGWRPNDILNFTDNVNNFQLGVLEVTRRTSVVLAERISRTGVTAAFDPNLERAMNWFMIKADRYWFPSAESKYKEGLEELNAYKKRLEKKTAPFYVRTDNLIPLLAAYVDLLGSCEENLVKFTEEDGNSVSFFTADDYFYYAKGVTSTMVKVLEAVAEDFALTVESRRGSEVLHHAIEACHHAIEINPIVITNSRLSGILANHRANMAAPVSHARFYLEVLVKTLST